MKKTSLFAALITLSSAAALAHPYWLLPSTTRLDKPGYIALDAGMSEDDMPFQLNHRALKLSKDFSVTAADGSKVKPENLQQSPLRTTLDLNLTQAGTYRIGQSHQGFVASWQENGKTVREKVTAADLASKVPAHAVGLELTEMVWRLEAFVTVGEPTELKPLGQGIEMIVVGGHVNRLHAGSTTILRLLADGEPVPGLDVSVVREGTRYRSQPEKIELKTDAKGEIRVRWPQAGMYLLEAVGNDKKPTIQPSSGRTFRYVATFEVMPK